MIYLPINTVNLVTQKLFFSENISVTYPIKLIDLFIIKRIN